MTNYKLYNKVGRAFLAAILAMSATLASADTSIRFVGRLFLHLTIAWADPPAGMVPAPGRVQGQHLPAVAHTVRLAHAGGEAALDLVQPLRG